MPSLWVEQPDRAPFEVELGRNPLGIGRSAQSDLSIPSLSLSRNHARILADGQGYLLEDSGSRNGTYLNGRPVTAPARLADGDEIRVGDVVLRFAENSRPAVRVAAASGELHRDETFILRKEDLSFRRFAQESRSGELKADIGATLWPVLNEAAATLIRHFELGELLEVIMDIVLRAVPAQRGALLLRRDDGSGGLEPRVVRQPEGQTGLQLSSTILQEAVEGRAVLTVDAQADDRFGSAQSIRIQGIRSVLCVPLWNDRDVTGLIYVDNLLSDHAFSQNDLRLLGLIANMAAVKVENLRLLRQQIEKERMDEQLAVAAAIQRRLLPQSDPVIAGYEVRALSRSCYEIGGDYYDFVERTPGVLAVVIADVSGKGVGAALLMAAFQASLRTLLREPMPLPAMVRRVSDLLLENSAPGKFVTAFVAQLDLATHRLTYVNAGHNPPVVLGAAGAVPLGATGPVVGLLPGVTYTEGAVELRAGDLVVLYTDGITEREGPGDDEYGLGRLSAFFAARRDVALGALPEALLENLSQFAGGAPPRDDSTVVLLKRTGTAGN
jgi:serine phosphatase RsbU (regulator of sigma subunit)